MNHKNKSKNMGFTLVEILISISILVVILSLGLFISMDFFRGRSSHSEQSVIVSLLQNARSQSMNNINQVRHGVRFISGQYIMFECPQASPQCTSYTASSSDLTVESSYNVSITSPTIPLDIIFEQLNGNCVNCGGTLDMVINDNSKIYHVLVNDNGRIDWELK